VVIKINSPGGTITASEQLYHEIKRFKSRTGLPLVAMLMDVAASGGYYAALPADEIIAHPTTITGSVGVIYLQPKVRGLLDKLGVEMEVAKSGDQKDMGSLFRATDPLEAQLIETMITQLAERFMGAMIYHRPDTEQWRSTIASARIFLGGEALELGLIDGLGYLTDAVARAQALAGLPEDATVVSYGRRPAANPTLYHSPQTQPERAALELLNPLAPLGVAGLTPGFHYLWLRGY
jgi:protease-4